MVKVYAEGHRVVVSFSGGKDSTATLGVCVEAATRTGRLPVEVMVQDEEIAYPGTYEFIERVASRPDVSLNWLVCRQPIINAFDREHPYWWPFDEDLQPSDWVRPFPPRGVRVPDMNLETLTNPTRFPPPPGKHLVACIGLRAAESRGRMYGIHSSGGYLTKPNRIGVVNARPIYDWSDGDVWKAILDHGWDYNQAYDVFHRLGVPRAQLRVGPPTMNAESVSKLDLAARAWPQWFDLVCRRVPGMRVAAYYGKRAVTPERRANETWEQTFQRTCIDNAPAWVAARARKFRDYAVKRHAVHATTPFPEVAACYTCEGNFGSWKRLTMALYNGDPFCTKTGTPGGRVLGWLEPEDMRPGKGRWEASHGW